MKLTKKILVILVTVFISTISKGQGREPVATKYLKGKWTASCPFEVVDHATIRNCELCPFVIDPDSSGGGIKDVEMTFQSDSIIINQNGKMTSVPWIRNKDTHSFSFILNNKQYNFRLFIYNALRIIEDNDGLLMVLEKAK